MISLFKVHMPGDVMDSLQKTLLSGYVAQGQKVEEFEQAFGAYVANARVAAVNSGTAALTLALRLANVENRSVVTTPMTCTATNLPILSLGAEPVWADVNPASGLIDPDSVDAIFKYRSRHRVAYGGLPAAIMCVDWGGAPCDLASLGSIAARWGVPLIEDAAHALGASYLGWPVGMMADFTCFSFQAIKHITTGDGGALTCLNDGDLARAKRLRWFGIDRGAPTRDSRIDVDIEEWGYKFHMNDVAATIGLAQLPYLVSIVERYRQNAAWYDEYLPEYFSRVVVTPGAISAWWLYTILLPDRESRDKFVKFMNESGVQVSRVHRPNDEYKVFESCTRGALPGVREFSSRMACIPVHWALTVEERHRVADLCRAFVVSGGGT